MIVTAIYDVSSNSIRKKLSDRLLDAGLIRVQKSVFLGNLDNNRIDELALYAADTLEEDDQFYVIPIHRDDLNAARIIGPGFDDRLVADEILTKVI
ncbi:MAG: CRISPR-associated endonuclease Cas2 [Planctomycetales bacterium]|nr:CRISPR-associated endonuclease Cas2 [Planctomycetales bacterium]